MEAEMARVRSQNDRATVLYEEAIASADEDGFPFNAALAAELGGRFFLGQDEETSGKSLLRRARAGYSAWGAGAKVDALDKEFPDLVVR
jgi:hypothetical protein